MYSVKQGYGSGTRVHTLPLLNSIKVTLPKGMVFKVSQVIYFRFFFTGSVSRNVTLLFNFTSNYEVWWHVSMVLFLIDLTDLASGG